MWLFVLIKKIPIYSISMLISLNIAFDKLFCLLYEIAIEDFVFEIPTLFMCLECFDISDPAFTSMV